LKLYLVRSPLGGGLAAPAEAGSAAEAKAVNEQSNVSAEIERAKEGWSMAVARSTRGKAGGNQTTSHAPF
jgi:hypothetical protein